MRGTGFFVSEKGEDLAIWKESSGRVSDKYKERKMDVHVTMVGYQMVKVHPMVLAETWSTA